MEHGRIEYQYRPALAPAEVKQLEALVDGQWSGGQLLLLFQNTTAMPWDIAATAWGHAPGCKAFNPGAFDARVGAQPGASNSTRLSHGSAV